jgi:N-acetylneuraminic acid mutarotase
MSPRLARSPLLAIASPHATLVVAVLAILASLVVGVPVAGAAAGWSGAGGMANPRSGHTATSLPNGKVLVAGALHTDEPFLNGLSAAELYDPATNGWSGAGSMATGRGAHTATRLSNGKVLVAGGFHRAGQLDLGEDVASAEIYDPATDGWTGAGGMATAREGHTATLLPNGKVLVVGGTDNNGVALASAEMYDPATNGWSGAASMATAREDHTATLLPNGKVLVAGGRNGSITIGGSAANVLTSTEVYDPATNGWSSAASMATARASHTATLLPNGKVLVAGGFQTVGGDEPPEASAEIYDPASDSWSSAAHMATGRETHTATLLDDGKVLVAGGTDSTLTEIYDPATDSWSGAGSMAIARAFHTATLLPNGRVLVAGGNNGQLFGVEASAELYTPPTAVVAPGVDFGEQSTGSPSAVRDVVVTNTGDSNLFVTGAVLGGVNASDFTVTDDGCTDKTVAPNGVCELGVRFTPSDDGSRTATLTLADNNATDGTDDVALTGTGTPTSGSGTGGEGTSPSGGGDGTAGGGATPPATVPVVGPVNTTAPEPAVSLKARQKLATVLKKGLVVTLSANEPATLEVELLLDRKPANKLKLKPRVGGATVTLAAAGSQKVTVKLSASARRKLAQQRRVKLTVSVRATDTAGNHRTRTTAVHLRN